MELFWCLVLYEIVLKSVKTIPSDSQDAPVHRMLINILANSVLQLIIFFFYFGYSDLYVFNFWGYFLKFVFPISLYIHYIFISFAQLCISEKVRIFTEEN